MITVNDCVGVRSGVAVTVTQGAYSWSATTNGSGIATFTGLPTGSATATATAPNVRFNNGTATRTLASGSQSNTIGLTAASGYVCCGCPDPLPTTLYLTDAYQTSLAFAWNGSKYSLCYTATDAVTGVDADPVTAVCTPVTQTFSRGYEMTCNGSGSFTLAAKGSYVGCGNLGSLYYQSLGRCNGGAPERWDYTTSSWAAAQSIGSKSETGCTPLSLSFAFAVSGAQAFQVGTVTVSE